MVVNPLCVAAKVIVERELPTLDIFGSSILIVPRNLIYRDLLQSQSAED